MTDAEYIADIANLQEGQFGLNVPTIKAHIERLKAIAKRLEDDKWKPIETAPKDGTCILLFEQYDTMPFIGYWSVHLKKWSVCKDHVYFYGDGWVEDNLSDMPIVGWKPLPKGPL